MVKINQNAKRGEELNQLSRLLFDNAAIKWYLAFILDLVVGGVSAIFALINGVPDNIKLASACLTVVLAIVAYILRQKFESQYDMAETMRRQSVLTEGLGYPIKILMFSEWSRRAGRKIRRKFKLVERNVDYYVTKKKPSPSRLLEMTQESAFWTRFLYSRLLELSWIILILFILIVTVVIMSLLLGTAPNSIKPTLSYAVFLIIPILITTNVIGWILKLKRLILSISEIEANIESLLEMTQPDEASVLRLVFEYNCQVVAGFPIPNFIFNSEYNKIQDEWNRLH